MNGIVSAYRVTLTWMDECDESQHWVPRICINIQHTGVTRYLLGWDLEDHIWLTTSAGTLCSVDFPYYEKCRLQCGELAFNDEQL